MKQDTYDQFTQTLTDTLSADERVLALVALGSMAGTDRAPDAWSDHDFFLIVQSGTQEQFRQSQAWLPACERICLTIRETEHGLKVLYDDPPHLVEFAVFDPDELSVAKVNAYRMLFDRADITARIERLRTVADDATSTTVDVMHHAGMVLALLFVGAGRYRRGEILSAHEFIKHHAVSHLLRMLPACFNGNATLLDNLDPFRRVEESYPQMARALHSALLQPPLDCALTLLDLLQMSTYAHESPDLEQAADVVRRYLMP